MTTHVVRYRVCVDVCENFEDPNREAVSGNHLAEIQKAMVSAAKVALTAKQARTVKIVPVMDGVLSFHGHSGSDCGGCYRLADDGQGSNGDELFPAKPNIALPT